MLRELFGRRRRHDTELTLTIAFRRSGQADPRDEGEPVEPQPNLHAPIRTARTSALRVVRGGQDRGLRT